MKTKLYLITDGEYSDYGVVELLEVPENTDWKTLQNEWLRSSEAKLLDEWERKDSQRFIDWLCNRNGFKKVQYEEVNLDWYISIDEGEESDDE